MQLTVLTTSASAWRFAQPVAVDAVAKLTLSTGGPKSVRTVVRGRIATVSTHVVLSGSTIARVTVSNAQGARLTLLPKSRVSDTVTGRARTAIVYDVPAGTCTMALRIPASQLARHATYVIRVTATDAAGQTAAGIIRFRH